MPPDMNAPPPVGAGTRPGKVPPRERDAVIQALRAGVVPRLGLHHVQVGRAREVQEVVRDMDRIRDGGSACRFVIGDYGAGKTFFLNLARNVAAERKLVVMHADLSPERRIHATGGQAQSLYAELARSMATRTKPDGGALQSVLERLVGDAKAKAAADGKDATVNACVEKQIKGWSFPSAPDETKFSLPVNLKR